MKRYSFQQLKEEMRNMAVLEASSQPIEATGATLEDALANAAKKAGAPPEALEYEIIDRGSRGIAGFGSLEYRILVKVNKKITEATESDKINAEDQDGKFYIRMIGNKILLKVTPPEENGAEVSVRKIFEALRERTDSNIEKKRVENIIKTANDIYEFVGYFGHDATQNGIAKCTIAPNKLTASIILFPAGLNGADVGESDVRTLLYEAGVAEGIDNRKLKRVTEYPEYHEPIDVAFGVAPQNGDNAIIKYHFEVSPSEYVLKAHKEAFDIKEFADLQNVREGEVIAEKTRPKLGKDGRTVTGEHIAASDGVDRELLVGANVVLSEDGSKAIAETSGLARIRADRIVVDPIYTVNGNAGVKTGSIKFVGSVIVKGNVEDNIEINAEGDINVLGTVGNSVLTATGNIYVLRGVSGGSECKLHSGASIIARFVENCNILVEDFLVVSDGIINSDIVSMNSIISRGRRASIVGGSITATKIVDTKNLGSKSGTKTFIEVGVDPQLRIKEQELTQFIRDATKEIQQLKNQVDVLERRIRNRSPTKKGAAQVSEDTVQLREVQEKLNELISERREREYELEAVKDQLESKETEGNISVYRKVYPGVQIVVCGEHLLIQQEQQHKTYVYRDGVVLPQGYEEPKVNIPRKQ